LQQDLGFCHQSFAAFHFLMVLELLVSLEKRNELMTVDKDIVIKINQFCISFYFDGTLESAVSRMT